MRSMLKSLSVVLIVSMFFSIAAICPKAADTNSEKAELSYSEYLEKYADTALGQNNIILKGDTAEVKDAVLQSEFQGKSNVVVVADDTNAEIIWNVNVENAGLYEASITYYTVEGRGNDIPLAVNINGNLPYNEAVSIALPIAWKDNLLGDEPFKTDAQGNDVVPERVQVPMWITAPLTDSSGYYSDPLVFYLEKGNNEISLRVFGEPVGIYSVELSKPDTDTFTYEEYKAEYSGKKDAVPENYIEKVQAERPTLKSDAYIYPSYEKSDPTVEPYDALVLKRNIIGTNWSSVGQFMEWEIDVPASGYYNIGVKYRQKTSEGVASLRKLLIDGEAYFDELENLEFQYTSKFEKQIFGNGKENYSFYLIEGKHTLRMEVTTGKYAETVRELDECTDLMNQLYRKIIMITSKTPDVYRDYDLDAEIPELLDSLSDIAKVLRNSSKELKEICNGNIDTLDLDETAETLESFVDKPYTISERLSNFSNSTSTMSTFVSSLCSQPLELDYIFITDADSEISKDKVSFFKRIYYSIMSFINSYTNDYSITTENAETKESIEVWTSAGREPVNVLRELISSSFVEENPDINVELKFVHTTLIQGVLAGIEPDVIIQVGGTDPVDLAMRDVLEPLNGYEGFNEVVSVFRPTTLDAFVFEGQTYAIPETISFDMMFVRDDVFDDLSIDVPQTWDEFKDVSKLILHKNMEVGIPNTTTFYITQLLQNGYNPYQDNNTRFNVQEPIALEVFKEWTEYYTDLSMPMFKDDLNRFRSGEMPICIMAYTFYNNLTVGAPEIRGNWSMYPIPGTISEEGKINRSTVGTVAGSLMLKASDNKQAAWKFIKWWTGAKTQSSYGKQLEYILGPSARYTAANPEAFSNLLWTKSEVTSIEEQWDSVKVMPNIPGGYYISRNLDNAFKGTAMNGKNYRESLNYWAEEINKEIARKRSQYGLDE